MQVVIDGAEARLTMRGAVDQMLGFVPFAPADGVDLVEEAGVIAMHFVWVYANDRAWQSPLLLVQEFEGAY
jgi:hypothetical protein